MRRFSDSDHESTVRGAPGREYYVKYMQSFGGAERVVDVGCGRGLFLKAVRRVFDGRVKGVGVDAGESAMLCARKQRLVAECPTAADSPAANPASFDGLFCSHLVEHLIFDQVLDLIEGVRAALRTGGTAVLRAELLTQFEPKPDDHNGATEPTRPSMTSNGRWARTSWPTWRGRSRRNRGSFAKGTGAGPAGYWLWRRYALVAGHSVVSPFLTSTT